MKFFVDHRFSAYYQHLQKQLTVQILIRVDNGQNFSNVVKRFNFSRYLFLIINDNDNENNFIKHKDSL